MTPATPGALPICPRCHRYREHPEHIKYGWCGYCHEYTGAPDNAQGFTVWAEGVEGFLSKRSQHLETQEQELKLFGAQLEREENRIHALKRHYRTSIIIMVCLVAHYGITGTYYGWHINPWLAGIPFLIIILGVIWAVKEWATLRRAQIKAAFDPDL